MRTPRIDGRPRVVAAARTIFRDPTIGPDDVGFYLRAHGFPASTGGSGWYWRDARTGSVLRIGASIAACERRAVGTAPPDPFALPTSIPCPRRCAQGMVLEIGVCAPDGSGLPDGIPIEPRRAYRCQDCDLELEIKD